METNFLTFLHGRVDENSYIKYLPKDIIQIIYTNYFYPSISDDEVMINDFLELLQFRYRNGTLGKNVNIQRAIELSSVRVVEWIYNTLEKNNKKPLAFMTIAIKNKKLEVAKWFYENKISFISLDLVLISSLLGDLEMIKWFMSLNECEIYFNYMTYINSVKSGNLELMELCYDFFIKRFCENKSCKLRTKYPFIDDKITCILLEKGHFDIIKRFKTKLVFTKYSMKSAICSGNIELVKWLFENFQEFNPENENIYLGCRESFSYACSTCNLEMIKWLHENRVEYNPTSKYYDTYSFSYYMLRDIVRYNRIDILEWLCINRPEFKVENYELYYSFHDVPYGPSIGFCRELMNVAIEYNNIEVIDWLYKNREEFNKIEI